MQIFQVYEFTYVSVTKEMFGVCILPLNWTKSLPASLRTLNWWFSIYQAHRKILPWRKNLTVSFFLIKIFVLFYRCIVPSKWHFSVRAPTSSWYAIFCAIFSQNFSLTEFFCRYGILRNSHRRIRLRIDGTRKRTRSDNDLFLSAPSCRIYHKNYSPPPSSSKKSITTKRSNSINSSKILRSYYVFAIVSWLLSISLFFLLLNFRIICWFYFFVILHYQKDFNESYLIR